MGILCATEFQATRIKIYFLITWVSQYCYQQIPGNPAVKSFVTEIHGESHPVSMCIPAMHVTTRYFTCDFHITH